MSLYRHNDGYPDGVLPDILPILARFDKERGLSDVEYAAAWTIHALIQDHVEHLAEIVQRCFTAVIEQFQAADTAEGTESNG